MSPKMWKSVKALAAAIYSPIALMILWKVYESALALIGVDGEARNFLALFGTLAVGAAVAIMKAEDVI